MGFRVGVDPTRQFPLLPINPRMTRTASSPSAIKPVLFRVFTSGCQTNQCLLLFEKSYSSQAPQLIKSSVELFSICFFFYRRSHFWSSKSHGLSGFHLQAPRRSFFDRVISSISNQTACFSPCGLKEATEVSNSCWNILKSELNRIFCHFRKPPKMRKCRLKNCDSSTFRYYGEEVKKLAKSVRRRRLCRRALGMGLELWQHG